MKRIAIRVDSSIQIGSGHLMRCMTLAEQLRKDGNICFISRNLEGNLNHIIESKGYEIFQLSDEPPEECLEGYEKWLTVRSEMDAIQTRDILLEADVDLLIVDHYAIDERWETRIRPYVKKMMVIDDLANRRHDCDILLDQNFYFGLETRYENLVPRECKLLLGPQHILLRDEFYESRAHLRARNGEVRHIFVFFGGSDAVNMTMRTLQVIVDIRRDDVKVHVVVGESNVNKASIQSFCEKHHMEFHCQINTMAKLMCEADLAIGAGGSTIWERCFLGLPSIVIAIAENQVQMSRACDSLGIIKYLGKAEEVEDRILKDVITKYMRNSNHTSQLSKRALAFWESSNCRNLVASIMAEQ